MHLQISSYDIWRCIYVLYTTDMLRDQLQNYANPMTKISRLIKDGTYIPINRGLYVKEKNIPGYVLAGAIYGPSYLSFDFVLAWYGLIPETVQTFTSATLNKRKHKRFRNYFGVYTYRDVPAIAYPLGVQIHREGNYYFQMATPEKALCDKVYTVNPAGSIRAIRTLIMEDLRIEESQLARLDQDLLLQISKQYPSSNVRLLGKLIRGL